MSKMFGRKSLVTCMTSLIVLVAYNILYFVIPFNRDLSKAAFWITYGITTFLILFNLLTVYLGIGDKQLRSRVFGVPIVQFGIRVTITQIIIDVLVMSIGNRVAIPYWIIVVIEVLLLSIFFISLIAQKAYKDTIIGMDAKEDNELFIKNFRIELDSILHLVISDAELKNNLRKLYETARYTTPVSKKCVYELEEDISYKVAVLKDAVKSADNIKATNLIGEITNLLRERKARLSV